MDRELLEANLIALSAALAHLTRFEWRFNGHGDQECPDCRHVRKHGHDQRCELDAALAAVKKAQADTQAALLAE